MATGEGLPEGPWPRLWLGEAAVTASIFATASRWSTARRAIHTEANLLQEMRSREGDERRRWPWSVIYDTRMVQSADG